MTTDRRAALLERLATAPARIAEAARVVDAVDAAAGGPPPGEWSAAEAIGHLCLLDSEVYQVRLASLAGAVPPRWTWDEPQPIEAPWMATTETALAEFALRRGALLARLAGLDETTWAKHGVHETFGPLDVTGLLGVIADHDDEHIAGILERAPERG